MNTLILYMSHTGSAKKVAEMVKNIIGEACDLRDLSESGKTDLNPFGRIIIGGSVKMGKIQSAIQKFCQSHENELLQKEIGLYVCCMYEGETAQKQFDASYSSALRNHAKATLIAGGEFSFEKMNFMEKMIVKKVAKVSQSISMLKTDDIKNFAEKMKL